MYSGDALPVVENDGDVALAEITSLRSFGMRAPAVPPEAEDYEGAGHGVSTLSGTRRERRGLGDLLKSPGARSAANNKSLAGSPFRARPGSEERELENVEADLAEVQSMIDQSDKQVRILRQRLTRSQLLAAAELLNQPHRGAILSAWQRIAIQARVERAASKEGLQKEQSASRRIVIAMKAMLGNGPGALRQGVWRTFESWRLQTTLVRPMTDRLLQERLKTAQLKQLINEARAKQDRVAKQRLMHAGEAERLTEQLRCQQERRISAENVSRHRQMQGQEAAAILAQDFAAQQRELTRKVVAAKQALDALWRCEREVLTENSQLDVRSLTQLLFRVRAARPHQPFDIPIARPDAVPHVRDTIRALPGQQPMLVPPVIAANWHS